MVIDLVKQFNVRATHTIFNRDMSRVVVNKNSKSPTFPLATLPAATVGPDHLEVVHRHNGVRDILM